MTHEAIVQITMTARNLADAALSDVVGGIDRVATAASTTASKVGGAFRTMSGALTNAFGNAIENLTTGGDLGPTLLMAGGYMAGQIAEEFGGRLLERLGSSAIVGAIAAPLGALGSAAGGLFAAAIPAGMALLPVLLVAALVAAVAVLIVNEDIRNRVIGFAGGLVQTLIDALGRFLGALPDVIGAAFAGAWNLVVGQVLPVIGQLVELWFTLPFRLAGLGLEIVNTIVRGLASLPGRVADIVRDAFANLRIDVGPFHISGQGIRVDLPDLKLPGFAEGVTNFRGGLAIVGERGPEVVRLPRGSDVIPNGRVDVGGSGGVTIRGVTERELVDMVERGMYFRLQLASPTVGST